MRSTSVVCQSVAAVNRSRIHSIACCNSDSETREGCEFVDLNGPYLNKIMQAHGLAQRSLVLCVVYIYFLAPEQY